MRISSLTPLRRPWPVTAAAAGREYRYRRKVLLPSWPTPVRTRWLPDGRFEISIAGCAPPLRLREVVRAHPRPAAAHPDGAVVEAGEVFVFEDEGNPYTFARLRVPRRLVVAGAA